jgi:VanZ family protein
MTATCVLTWMAAFAATHVPGEHIPATPGGPAVMHLLGYFVLTVLFTATLSAHRVRRARRVLLASIVMPVYGALDEWTQSFVGRDADVVDCLVDVAGAITAMILVELVLAARNRRNANDSPPSPETSRS